MPLFQGNNIPFSALTWRRWGLTPLKSFPSRPVYGFDTETLDGYCRLLTCSDGRVYEGDDIDEMLSFLTFREYRSAHNFFYNIDYDMDAILKYLPEETLKNILVDGSIEYQGYKISCIPGKVYTFRKDKHRYSYYDLWQFYDSSLEQAARKYLGEQKNPDALDRAAIGSSCQYWHEHHDSIVKYCLLDSTLTMRLGKALQKEVSSTFGFTPKNYVSKAGLSKQYFRYHCQIPDTRKIPRSVMEFAFNSYHGGRFEVTERGRVGESTAIDINSAYPYQIANLLDITQGEWRHGRRVNEESDYGFYACRVIHHYTHLPTLPIKVMGQTFYPYGKWYTYLTKDEIEALKGKAEVTVYAGWEFFADEEVYPFREAIHHLYNQKSKAPKGSYRYSLYKIVMNALYGAFYEKVLTPEGKYRVGSMFNPVYASLITARTRVTLTKEAWKYKNNAVCLATDGILVKGHISIPESQELGAFSQKEQGDALILRSGIYSIADDVKQRGLIKAERLKTPYGVFASIFDYLEAYPALSEYPVFLHRPIHLREALRHTKSLSVSDVNRFKDLEMTFNLNSEVKRVFEKKNLTGKDLLESSIPSRPWDVSHLLPYTGKRGRGKG